MATVVCALGCAAVASAAPAVANTITFQLDERFGGYAPKGPGPWLTATFTDIGPDAIELTLNATGLRRGEFLGNSGFLFNLDPFRDGPLTATWKAGRKGTMSFGEDAYMARRRGPFDAMLSFAPGHRLRAHQESVWTLRGFDLSTADILGLGSGENSRRDLDVASLVEGIPRHGRRGAGWITDTDPLITFTRNISPPLGKGDLPTAVPLPASVWLFAGALGGLALTCRRRTTAHNSPVMN